MVIMLTLDNILWVAAIGAIFGSIFRALNLGFQKETYIITAFAQLPLIYREFNSGSYQMILLNIFYLIIAFIGIWRWTKNKRSLEIEIKKKKKE